MKGGLEMVLWMDVLDQYILLLNGSDTICIQLDIVFSKMCTMLNIAHLYKFTYIMQLTAICTRQDIM